MNSLWKQSPLPDEAWKSRPHLSRAARAAEQDEAAGGRAARLLEITSDKRAHASVALRVNPRGRRVYAYLRWFSDGKTHERYIGEVEATSRAANLAQAWSRAQQAGLLRAKFGDSNGC